MGAGVGGMPTVPDSTTVKNNSQGSSTTVDLTGLSPEDRFQAEKWAQDAEKQRVKDQIAQATGYYENGMQVEPEFQSMLGDNGFLNSDYRLGENFQSIGLDNRAYDKYAQEALRDGPSTATQMMLEKINLDRDKNIDSASRQGMSAQSMAMADLASRGGLSGGSRERLASQSAKELMLNRQNANRDAQGLGLNALVNDENQRINSLQNMNSMALSQGQFNQSERQSEMAAKEFDIRNALTEQSAERDHSNWAWEEKNKMLASEKQAQATASSGGGCFLEGELISLSDGKELPIEDVSIGMVLEAGGRVTGLYVQELSSSDDLYDYLGVMITGRHAVIEDERFVRIKDSRNAIKITTPIGKKVYNLVTEDHLIISNGILFSDFQELDVVGASDEMAILLLNRGLEMFSELVV